MEERLMNLSRAYDHWHQEVFASAPAHPDESSPWYRLVLEYLGSVENERILEIACGRGGFSRLLASRGAHIVGADFSISALRIARQRLQGRPARPVPPMLAQADAQSLPFSTNSFDVVISCETIEHLRDPRAAVREMARVTRPGGLLYLTTPNYLNLIGLYELYAKVRHPGGPSGLVQPLDRHYVFFQTRRVLRKAGWKILRTDGTVYQAPFLPRHNPVEFPWLESIRAVRRFLSPFAFHYFVMAQKPSAPPCAS